jgi:hypothetical protein
MAAISLHLIPLALRIGLALNAVEIVHKNRGYLHATTAT